MITHYYDDKIFDCFFFSELHPKMQETELEMDDIPIDFRPTLTITGDQNGSVQRPSFVSIFCVSLNLT